MTSEVNKLSALKIARLTKTGIYNDGGGLYLQIRGKARSWIFRYALDGKTHYLGLGSAATFGLAEARERARAARQLVADGIDPVEQRRGKRAASRAEAAKRMTLREAARHYVASHEKGWSAKHAAQWSASLEQHVFPLMGDLDVAAIDTAAVMKTIEPLWSEKPVTADRCRGRLETLFDWAAARHLREGPNAARWKGHLSKLLPPVRRIAVVKHLAAMPYSEVPGLVQRLRNGAGDSACAALEFVILTAARSGEVLGATWGEIDLERGLWVVPASRMKAGREHRVPLSDRALALLRGLPAAPGTAEALIFPRSSGQPLTHKDVLKALRSMGGTGLTVHGFRSAFRDWVGERSNFPGELAEAALAHVTGDATERAYRRGDAIEKRRRLMQAWAGFCCTPPAAAEADSSGKVLPMRR
jgi:integrase